MKRKEREGEGGEGAPKNQSPQKKRVRFSDKNEVTNIPKAVQKREKAEVGDMPMEEELAMVRDILGVAGAVAENKKKEEREDYEKEAKEKSEKLFKDDLEEEYGDGTTIDEKEVVIPLGEANDRFLSKPDEVRMEPFNMKREMDFGDFVGGHYVEKREEGVGMEDAWYDGVTDSIDAEGESYYSKARKIELERQKKRAKQEKEAQEGDVEDMKGKILEYLNDGETISGALRRLAPPKQARAKKRKAKGDDAMVTESPTKAGKEEVSSTAIQFDALTSLSSDVYSLGFVDIYEEKKEKIEADVRGMKWEYKGEGGKMFGPYKREELEGWRAGGYFVGDYTVDVRKIFDGPGGKTYGEWKRSDSVSF
uniref:GYF domain-containing protein n=1 Tax=Paramoeba aestuarina TaxID=180227 RepID=A0A7S4KVV2_9EUKA|mmetsp:Transcript_26487/g.41236  ORF Transcript_26487/g.41236 Transcript_26487/m.41236 type:complete len:365 (+) Transcript_26487:39-1133(+)